MNLLASRIGADWVGLVAVGGGEGLALAVRGGQYSFDALLVFGALGLQPREAAMLALFVAGIHGLSSKSTGSNAICSGCLLYARVKRNGFDAART
ncbi:MAG: hypothetical protein CBE00_07870 [Planctomycetaceae bacterium TMED240]|nr:MAG: hypothetical protein CBE00_07870 [Planctomycetaceae bacterium TMED240]